MTSVFTCARGPGRGPCHHGRRGRRGPPPRRGRRCARARGDGSSAGMIPSVSASRRKASSASSSVAVTYCARGRNRAAARARGRRRDSRAPRRSSAHPRSDRPRRQAGPSERRARRRAARHEAGGPGCLHAHEAHVRVVDEGGEEADGVRASADARHHGFRQPSLGGQELLAGLLADHRLQLPDDGGIRVRADAGADEVVRRADVRDPVANRLARRLLERARAEVDGANLGAEQAHALDVGPLAPHVL